MIDLQAVPVEIPDDIPSIEPYTLEAAREDAKKAGRGVSTGFEELDAMRFRFRPGRLYAVAGRPGEGKTMLLLELLLRHVESRAETGEPTGGPATFVTFEMNRFEIYGRAVQRICAKGARGGVIPSRDDLEEWLRGEIESEPLDRAAAILDGYARDGFLAMVDGDRDGGDIDTLLDTLGQVAEARDEPPSLVVLDYFQKILPPGDMRGASRQEKLQAIADLLRRFAKGGSSPALACPVLVGAQVNREASEGQPRLRHIREADDLANDASGVLTLYRPDDPPESGRTLHVAVVKNRDGQRGGMPIDLSFDGPSGLIMSFGEQGAR